MEIKEENLGADSTMGFVNIKNFEGCVTTISLDRLVKVLKLLKDFKDIGIGSIDIGISSNKVLLIFFNKKLDTAFAVAPYLKEDK